MSNNVQIIDTQFDLDNNAVAVTAVVNQNNYFQLVRNTFTAETPVSLMMSRMRKQAEAIQKQRAKLN